MFRFRQSLKSRISHVSLSQMNEQLNDAFETYFPRRGPLYMAATLFILMAFRLRVRAFRGCLLVNERIVEYPQIYKWIRPEGVVLDIGCVSSRLPIQLASLGYEVHGVDARPYPFQHPNFHFSQADVFEWIPERSFDIVLLISTIEHFGMGDYGDEILPDADKAAIERISDWLVKGGQLLVTVPFGKPQMTRLHRVYDLERLKWLFADYTWMNQRYFRRDQNAWLPSNAEELREVASPKSPPNGVALLNLKRS